MPVTRASRQQHPVLEKRATEAVIEFLTDDTAKPGDVIPALARLLLSLAAKPDLEGTQTTDELGSQSGHGCHQAAIEDAIQQKGEEGVDR
jgi:hypothetical protein